LQGGDPGTPAWNILNPGKPNERILPTLPMEAVELRRDDVLRIQTAGAGGWGDPLEREPDRVLADVIDEKIDVELARRSYCVVIEPESGAVDEQATAMLRAERRAERNRAANPTKAEAEKEEA
jgi:N-methylhydantoinase B